MYEEGLWLFMSLFPSAIGFVLLSYGRKRERFAPIVAGVLFLAYPYFTPDVIWMLGIGLALGVATATAIRLGW